MKDKVLRIFSNKILSLTAYQLYIKIIIHS